MVKSTWNTLRQELVDLLFLRSCLACEQGLTEPQRTGLCLECQQKMTDPNRLACLRCAATVGPFASDEDGCIHCRNDAFAFEEVIALGRYETELAQACLRCKHERNYPLTRLLTRKLIENHSPRWAGWDLDGVVAVPTPFWRWGRRFNAAPGWMATEAAHGLKIPYLVSCLRQIRSNRPQHTLAQHERTANVRDLYQVRSRKCVEGKNLLIVDDILTSGQTMHQIAKLLKKAGAKAVYVAVLARAHRRE